MQASSGQSGFSRMMLTIASSFRVHSFSWHGSFTISLAGHMKQRVRNLRTTQRGVCRAASCVECSATRPAKQVVTVAYACMRMPVQTCA